MGYGLKDNEIFILIYKIFYVLKVLIKMISLF